MYSQFKKMNVNAVLWGTALILLQASCSSGKSSDNAVSSVPHYRIPSQSVSIDDSNISFQIGGYGSDLAYFEKDRTFWLLTDRGPNVDNQSCDGKIFPQPEFCPRIGIFAKEKEQFVLKREILLKDTNNIPFTGLPIKDSPGSTGEVAYDMEGKEIHSYTRHGIDPEGLAVLPDSSFWVSEEYGPFLMHFDKTGRCIESLSPFDGTMPRHYQKRKPNRGLEGLCSNPNGTFLYGIMQSPLTDSQDHTVPLFKYDTSTKVWSEYKYPLDADSDGANALCWINDSILLVLERDGKFPSKNFHANKKVYKVCLTQSVQSLEKTLVLDIVKTAPDYVHDKVEGIAMIGDSILCIANDDDFGITSPEKPDNTVIVKNTSSGSKDFNELWFFKIK